MNKHQHFNKKFKPHEGRSHGAQSWKGNGHFRDKKLIIPSLRNAPLKLAITPKTKWFEFKINPCTEAVKSVVSQDVISNLKTEAQSFFEEDIKLYKKYKENPADKSDFVWIDTILRNGTLADKVSAHVLLIQDSAVHNFSSIETLVGMVTMKRKRECLLALGNLPDLFLSDLLIKDEKLKRFDQQPLSQLEKITDGDLDIRRKQLIVWLFEDKVKSIYGTFLKNLEAFSHDVVEKCKMESVMAMYKLLKHNPEQEQFLLEHLVNKIGDPVRKVGSQVSYALNQLLCSHPNMKEIVALEVERMLFRANMLDRAKYYCLCFLIQIQFSLEDYKLASHLIKVYFNQFKVSVQKGEVDTRTMSALLTGVSRAYPYSLSADNEFYEQLDGMYKLVHLVGFNISIQALRLIFQVLDSKHDVSNRFYCSLYRKLLDPAVYTTSQPTLLLNLLRQALKRDLSDKRAKAFAKRMLQVCIYQEPPLQSGILYLISDIFKTHRNLLDNAVPNFGADSDDEEYYEDVIDHKDEELHKDSTTSSGLQQLESDSKGCPSSWTHKGIKKPEKSSYDPLCRDPAYAGAEHCPMWELRYLKNSYHPTVRLFAHQVSADHKIGYTGDPLQDFSLTRFLDRFVYRNPKKVADTDVQDKQLAVFGRRRLYIPTGSRKLPVTSDEYLNQSEENVPVEEDFIFRYLKKRKAEKKTKKDIPDIESVNSDDFEVLLNKLDVVGDGDKEGKNSIDFFMELNKTKDKGSKKRKNMADESESGSDMLDNEEDDEDFEDDFEGDEDFKKVFEEFDEDDEVEDNTSTKPAHKSIDGTGGMMHHRQLKTGKRKPKSFEKSNLNSVFASADKFAELLEENATSAVDSTTTNAFASNSEREAKQIMWEQQRDRQIRGKPWKKGNFKKFTKRKRGKKN